MVGEKWSGENGINSNTAMENGNAIRIFGIGSGIVRAHYFHGTCGAETCHGMHSIR